MYSHFLNVRVSCLDLILCIRFRLVSRFYGFKSTAFCCRVLVEVCFFLRKKSSRLQWRNDSHVSSVAFDSFCQFVIRVLSFSVADLNGKYSEVLPFRTHISLISCFILKCWQVVLNSSINCQLIIRRSAIGTSELILSTVRSCKLFAQAAINFREKRVMLYYATNPHYLLDIISWFPLLWAKKKQTKTHFCSACWGPESNIRADEKELPTRHLLGL